jgi:molecular chaperone HtpG
VQSNIDLQPGKIQLYCNQVFVTDQVEGIVPQFLTLLHGVIDSPDIPLNVSRSYLQSDANVKKISTYITKKVADRLSGIFKSDRADYEKKWDDLKIFINFGMLTDESFYDRAKDFALVKDVDGKYFTLDEYKTLIQSQQTDKDGNLVYLYANNADEQYAYIENAKSKGYSVLILDGGLDTSVVSMLEQKLEKSRFTRVDADIIDRLIVKEESKESTLSEDERKGLTETFNAKLPTLDKTTITVEVTPMGETGAPAVLTQNEYMRRMKDISRYQSGMGFYQQMPDTYTLVLNSDNETIKAILADANGKEDTIEQIIDLALLQTGLLKGAALDKFIKRSYKLTK